MSKAYWLRARLKQARLSQDKKKACSAQKKDRLFPPLDFFQEVLNKSGAWKEDHDRCFRTAYFESIAFLEQISMQWSRRSFLRQKWAEYVQLLYSDPPLALGLPEIAPILLECWLQQAPYASIRKQIQRLHQQMVSILNRAYDEALVSQQDPHQEQEPSSSALHF